MPFGLWMPVDDDVGGVAEDAGPDDGQRDADDREHQHRGDAQPLGCEAVQEAPDRALEVLRLLDRHADAEAGARVHRDALPGFGDLVLVALLPCGPSPFGRSVAVRALPLPSAVSTVMPTSSATNCDSTISWYVGQDSSSSRCVPRPTMRPSSSTRIWSALHDRGHALGDDHGHRVAR